MSNGSTGSGRSSGRRAPTIQEIKRIQEESARAAYAFYQKVRAYESRVAAYESCVGSRSGQCTPPPRIDGSALVLPAEAGVVGSPAGPSAPAAASVITITPQQAAYVAAARLTLTAPKPGIGPPPSINKWKMAAVGYPLWLWADGATDPGPVSDAVAGLSVRLDPRIDRVVFLMGDGESTTCRGTGTKWTMSVAPGAESPTCGYRYEKPSLPEGDYTVTAQTRWMVDWTINGVSGSIPIVQEASTRLPVGELQALVR